jgi:hypothetical protein
VDRFVDLRALDDELEGDGDISILNSMTSWREMEILAY